jgi:hypothetical protein
LAAEVTEEREIAAPSLDDAAASAFCPDEIRVYQWLDTSRSGLNFFPTLYSLQRRDPERGWVYITKNKMPVMFESDTGAEAECIRYQNTLSNGRKQLVGEIAADEAAQTCGTDNGRLKLITA